MNEIVAKADVVMPSADYDEEQREFYFIADIVFSICFALSFVLVLAMSIYNFRTFTNMINLSNVLVVIFLLLTLLSKLPIPYADSFLCRPISLPLVLTHLRRQRRHQPEHSQDVPLLRASFLVFECSVTRALFRMVSSHQLTNYHSMSNRT